MAKESNKLGEFFAKNKKLVGESGFNKLAKSKVLICGLGGVGGFAVESLARSGIGNIILVDFDIIDPSNINRQIIALKDTIGLPKIEVAKARIEKINPNCNIKIIDLCLNKENISQLLKENDCDYIIDAIDDVNAKVYLVKEALANNIKIISSMGTANKMQPEKLKIADISKTKICPLARKIRQELKKCNIKKGLTVLYSEEIPIKTKKGLGTMPFVPPIAGICLANWVVRDILAYKPC